MKFFLACDSIRSNSSFLRSAIIVVVILPALFFACSSHPKGPAGKSILKSYQLVNLLVDLYYYESIYTVAGHEIRHMYDPDSDSLDYYLFVFEKHNTTREKFRETMKYYSYNPSQLESIYDRVVDELKKRHAESEREVYEEPPATLPSSPAVDEEPSNLWNLDSYWLFPGRDDNKMISFDIPVPGPGLYTFSADIRLDPDDKSVNPAVNIYFWYDDGSDDGYVEDFGTFELIKDGLSHNITLSARLNNAEVTHIRGRILDMDNHGEGFERHAMVQNITLRRETS